MTYDLVADHVPVSAAGNEPLHPMRLSPRRVHRVDGTTASTAMECRFR